MESSVGLEGLRIASPCGVAWDDMRGDDRVRHCDHCMLNVYNIASMSRDEAMALIRAHEGERVCLRLMRREDGTVITSDCPVGLSRVRRRLRRLASGVAALLGLTGAAVAVERYSSGRGVESVRASSPFSWISRHVYGRVPPPPQTQTCVLGAIAVPMPNQPSTTPITVDGAPTAGEIVH